MFLDVKLIALGAVTASGEILDLTSALRRAGGTAPRDVAELIKNLSDRRGRVQLVLAGVAADLTGRSSAQITVLRDGQKRTITLQVPRG